MKEILVDVAELNDNDLLFKARDAMNVKSMSSLLTIDRHTLQISIVKSNSDNDKNLRFHSIVTIKIIQVWNVYLCAKSGNRRVDWTNRK